MREARKFGTMTGDLEAMREWLVVCGVTHAAMESTGSYYYAGTIVVDMWADQAA